MAVTLHPLPAELFDEPLRPHIKRLNMELRDLAGLEGTIRQPRDSRRSDATVARGEALQVHTSRITPSISEVVAGSSTVVGIPQLTLGTTNAVGSTTTAVSINSTVALFGTQAPAALAATAAVGTSAYAARADHAHKFPPTLLSTANDSSMTLTDDATDQTLTFGLGLLNIVPGTGIDIDFPNNANAALVVRANTTTAAAILIAPQGRPTAGTRGLMIPNWFAAANTTDSFVSQTFRCWDAQFSLWPNAQIESCTIVPYDASIISITPASGSTGGNNLYGIRFPVFQINNANATWNEIATAYFKGCRRSISNITATTLSTVIVEPPTAGTTAQIGILIRQSAAQAVATTRSAIWVEAQNSGTNRYSFYGVSDILYQGGTIKHNGARVGLYGATPTVQFGTTGTEAGFTAGTSTAVTVDSTFTGNTGTLAYTLGDCIRALKLLGGLAY